MIAKIMSKLVHLKKNKNYRIFVINRHQIKLYKKIKKKLNLEDKLI